jgi:hypothetical protein
MNLMKMLHLLVLLPVHSCPGKLGRLQAVVEVALAFRVGKQKNLGISTNEPDTLAWVYLLPTKTAKFSLQNHLFRLGKLSQCPAWIPQAKKRRN